MDLYITFYIKWKRIITICNGFSFGRVKKPEDIDLFFNIYDDFTYISKEIKKYNPNRIWCSVINDKVFSLISPILDKRWILGGPNIQEYKKYLEKFDYPCTFVYTTMEKYLGNPTSSEYDPYYDELLKKFPNSPVVSSCSLESGCYWGACTFCFLDTAYYYVRDVEKIFKNLNDNTNVTYHTCVSSIKCDTLKQIIKYKKPEIKVSTYIRADDDIIAYLDEVEDLSKFVFLLGIEGFAQPILDTLNKGMTIENIFKFIRTVVEKKGQVCFTLMDNYTFLTKEIVEEYIYNFKCLEDIQKKLDKERIFFSGPYNVRWETKELAERDGTTSYTSKRVSGKKYYLSEIPDNNIQKVYNKQIRDFIKTTSLKPVEY